MCISEISRIDADSPKIAVSSPAHNLPKHLVLNNFLD